MLASNGLALWYLTRGSGAVALILLTVSVLLGVMNSTRWRTTRWPRFLVFGLHRNVTLIAIAFVVVHVVTTVTDAFAPIGLVDAFVPFLSPYRPVWLGLGAVAFDLLLALTITSMLRRRIGVRAWRLVHWLAYASWPVAMLHSLGTGSDARTGWLTILSVVCGLTVVAAVAWRVAAVPDAQPLVRAGATLGAIGVAVGLVAWAQSGPRKAGWAARAGTPAPILARFGAARVAPQTSTPAASTASQSSTPLPKRLDASLRGTLAETPTGNGLVVVRIDLRARGRFDGRVHVALRGQPVSGGGVEMIDSVVGLLPRNGQSWAPGRVIGLEGQRILASIQASGGRSLHVLLDLRIDPSSHRVTGVLRNAGTTGEAAE